jgi:hypothetical protein
MTIPKEISRDISDEEEFFPRIEFLTRLHNDQQEGQAAGRMLSQLTSYARAAHKVCRSKEMPTAVSLQGRCNSPVNRRQKHVVFTAFCFLLV